MSDPAQENTAQECPRLQIIGGGPAGSAAAIAALREGARVELFEKSPFPRHKVCGEFLSPEIAPVLEQLGVLPSFLALAPARIAHARLVIESSEKSWQLADPAYGLSRFALDHLLLQHAASRGAIVRREPCFEPATPAIIAHGRKSAAPAGSRIFGFKAHFTGPANKAIELFFFGGCYVGVSAVENGITNVCGLAPEALLRARNFEIEPLFRLSKPLTERLSPMARAMDWILTGPLLFRDRLRSTAVPDRYPAGDALGFVDPFTGSGMLAAIATGAMAGAAAARQSPVERYLRDCRELLGRQYAMAALFRFAIASGWAETLAPLLPGRLLFQLTRPRWHKKSR